MHTRYVVLISLAWLLFSGCAESQPASTPSAAPQEGAVQTAADSAAIAAKAKILAYPPLSEDNCEAFLSQWEPDDPGALIRVDTKYGPMTLELFEDVPLHAANFRYKVQRGYYRPSEFVRIVPEFVVQGGNSEDPRAQEMRWLIGKHTLPSEFNENHRHVRGAVAMGRTYKSNPDKRSASYDFYIVVGRDVTSRELQQIEREKGITYSEAQKARYLAEGGTPHLDNEHTVFGRLVDGWDVLDQLSQVPTDESDWPLQRLEMRVSAVN